MATCENCLHVEVCAYIKPDLPVCADFADRNRYTLREKGEWIDHLVRDWRCSNCGEKIKKVRNVDGYCYDDKPNFCPNCGADMRKGRTDEET